MEEKLKAMSTSLPLVGDLAHPAMRDRHWEQLMRATGKTFVKDDKFSLGDLLALGLHNYVDDCSEIVDRAQKVRTLIILNKTMTCREFAAPCRSIFDFCIRSSALSLCSSHTLQL